jgi:hypothetical protein
MGRSRIPIDAPKRIQNAGATCAVDWCDRPALNKGWCDMHAKRARRGADMNKPPNQKKTKPTGPCAIDGCAERAVVKSLCRLHYGRKFYADNIAARKRQARADGFVTVYGYRRVQVDGRQVAEHRLVVERHIGRRLLPGENVHHRNGNRLDNRLENLELWASAQPVGQRAADLLAYAEEILARYAPIRDKI